MTDENGIDYEEVDMGIEGEVPNSDIDELLDAIQSKNYTDAEQKFNELVGDKLQYTLDQAKAKIAGEIYNGESETDDEEEE